MGTKYFCNQMNDRPTIQTIMPEVQVLTARSGGSGGQHVNKVETKVILKWNARSTQLLTELQKHMVLAAHVHKLTNEGELIVSADSKRSQLRNKEIAMKKLDRLLAQAFVRKKKRIATKPTKASQVERLDRKKKHSEKKANRRFRLD